MQQHWLKSQVQLAASNALIDDFLVSGLRLGDSETLVQRTLCRKRLMGFFLLLLSSLMDANREPLWKVSVSVSVG